MLIGQNTIFRINHTYNVWQQLMIFCHSRLANGPAGIIVSQQFFWFLSNVQIVSKRMVFITRQGPLPQELPSCFLICMHCVTLMFKTCMHRVTLMFKTYFKKSIVSLYRTMKIDLLELNDHTGVVPSLSFPTTADKGKE